MKKILLALSLFLGTASFVGAQTTPSKTVHKKTEVTKESSSGTKTTLKKDGTPDKRFKENKTTTTTVETPKKKDGSPDMRYKVNKTKTTTKTTTP